MLGGAATANAAPATAGAANGELGAALPFPCTLDSNGFVADNVTVADLFDCDLPPESLLEGIRPVLQLCGGNGYNLFKAVVGIDDVSDAMEKALPVVVADVAGGSHQIESFTGGG